MSSSSDSTQIVIVLQPNGESETAELLERLGTLASLEPSEANAEVSEILGDDELRRVMWATCEVHDLHSFAAYDALASALEKMLSLRPHIGGRLKAMLLIEPEGDGEAETDKQAAEPSPPIN